MQQLTSDQGNSSNFNPTGTIVRRSWAALLIAAVFAIAMLYYHLLVFMPKVLEVRAAKGFGGGYSFGDDFYPVWLTAREAMQHHRDLYGPEMTREIQVGLFGRPLEARRFLDPPTQYREFAYPAFVDLLFFPLAYLPFPTERLLFAILLPILTASGVLLWLKAMRFRASPVLSTMIVLLTLCSYQGLEGLFAEQLGLVVGFLVAASMAALTADKYLASGTLLALCTIKPQMVILLILFFLLWTIAKWKERYLLVVGFAVTEMMLCTSALLIWPHWIQQWLWAVLDYRKYGMPPLIMVLVGSKLGPLLGPPLIAILIAVGIAVAWHARLDSSSSPEFWISISLLLAITVITALPGQAVHDHIMLLPGILLVIQQRHRLRISRGPIRGLLFLATGALVWQWIGAIAIIAVRPLISAARFYSPEIFVLPIRMAEPFPFALLALLAVMKRTVLRPESQ